MFYEYVEKPDDWLLQEGDRVLIHTTFNENEYVGKTYYNGFWLVIYKVSSNQRAFKCLFDPKDNIQPRPILKDTSVDVSDFVFTTKHICQVKRYGIVIFSDMHPPTKEKKIALPQF